MKCSEQAVPLWAVSCFSGSFDAASEDVLMRHQKVLRRGVERCALRPPNTAIRCEFRDGGCLEATQVYKYLSRVDKLRANPAGFRVSAAQPKSDAGGRPQVVLRHVGRAAVKGAARMAGAASSGRPIPDGELVRRGHMPRPRRARRESSPSHLHERRRLGSQSDGQGVLRRKHINYG